MGRISTTAIPLRALFPTNPTQSLRTLRGLACPRSHCLSRNDVLALQQLPDQLVLPFRYNGHLAPLLPNPHSLPELGPTQALILAHRRRGWRLSPPRKRHQSHHPHPSTLETRSIRLPAHARDIRLRESPLHHRLALQLRPPLGLR